MAGPLENGVVNEYKEEVESMQQDVPLNQNNTMVAQNEENINPQSNPQSSPDVSSEERKGQESGIS